jgi:hypothetical protein
MADLTDVLACALPDPPADERPVAGDTATDGRDGATASGAAGSDRPDQRTRRELRRELVLRALI